MPKAELLVEGKDEKHVIKNLCRHKRIDAAAFTVVDLDQEEGAGGVERLLSEIEIRVKAAVDGDRLAIVVDADDDFHARWAQLRDRLARELGEEAVPKSPSPQGTLIDADDGVRSIRVGIWIMPDDAATGMLEDFLATLVPPDLAPLLGCVDVFLEAASRHVTFPIAKARIHAYLAVQPKPGRPLGLALTFRYLAIDSPIAVSFVDWLHRALIAPS